VLDVQVREDRIQFVIGPRYGQPGEPS